MASGGQGVWVITPEGVSRLKAAPTQPAPSPILESAALMIEKGIGVRSRAVEIYEDQIENLFEK
jgi:hypothetical protein